MKCKICQSEKTEVIYNGVLKTGLLEGWTETNYDVFRCKQCGTIWNHAFKDIDISSFYETKDYWTKIEKDLEIDSYYEKYDKEVLFKLNVSGTGEFRGKTVADIGCAGGNFLDFVKGVAKETVAIEPSAFYRDYLMEKGHEVYAYTSQACEQRSGSVDIAVSFDVIEHVEDPQGFLNDIKELLSENGRIIIGTPTDYPVLRKMLGTVFDRFIFQVQHPWVFSVESMRIMAVKAGFRNIRIECRQKYGLGNLLSWLLDGKPRGDIQFDFIDKSVNEAYKMSMCEPDKCEYLVLYAEK